MKERKNKNKMEGRNKRKNERRILSRAKVKREDSIIV